ncbi:uncharacterized protein BDV17DRAFT_68495 [Aspergillus undulatus]|uniref:uncharacterized protein n=1 Tax=Aspergillus undulatus TaxID=1810928 RepID=UPI003CCD9529
MTDETDGRVSALESQNRDIQVRLDATGTLLSDVLAAVNDQRDQINKLFSQLENIDARTSSDRDIQDQITGWWERLRRAGIFNLGGAGDADESDQGMK